MKHVMDVLYVFVVSALFIFGVMILGTVAGMLSHDLTSYYFMFILLCFLFGGSVVLFDNWLREQSELKERVRRLEEKLEKKSGSS